MSDARARILARLAGAPRRPAPDMPEWTPPAYGDGRLARFRAMLEASHAEVHEVTAADWPARLKQILAAKGVATLAYGPSTEAGRRLAAEYGDGLLAYDRPVEQMKDDLVQRVDAGFTTTLGAVAETGSLILWPGPAEPRLLSLLPPIHVALVEAARVADSLAEAIRLGGWAAGMPTNALLISGPSKTADIEQTLAYGVHGPKELVVLVVS
ncbi:MAG: LutC/YkgG family protein [Actinomycetota bacterium]